MPVSQLNVFLIRCVLARLYKLGSDVAPRLTSFPLLLSISFYERQSKHGGTVTIYDTITHVAERIFDTLPRSLKRMSKISSVLLRFVFIHHNSSAIFEGLAGADADIDAVGVNIGKIWKAY
jgi:hypothetical protein